MIYRYMMSVGPAWVSLFSFLVPSLPTAAFVRLCCWLAVAQFLFLRPMCSCFASDVGL